ncbi:MAG: hypothetical protein LC122_13755 [Chitinophagales bacterium]|nr:hypothetical protein [Chitinophagales bacterium]
MFVITRDKLFWNSRRKSQYPIFTCFGWTAYGGTKFSSKQEAEEDIKFYKLKGTIEILLLDKCSKKILNRFNSYGQEIKI